MKQAFINCTVLDGTKEMTPLSEAVVLVKDGRIEAVGKGLSYAKDYQVIDLHGGYLMPGLINMHTHLPGGGKPHKVTKRTSGKVEEQMKSPIARQILKWLCYKRAVTELMSGVTTLRTVGGLADLDTTIRDEISSGKKIGPRILAANLGISVPKGHMAGIMAYPATSVEEAVAYVDKIAKDRPDLIKLMVTGGVIDADEKGEPGVLRMPPEYVKAACDRAHELGYPVAAHAESTRGVTVCVENGVDTIEHGAILTEETITQMKARGCSLITTISPSVPTVYMTDEPVSETHYHNGKIVHEGIVAAAKAALANDIPVALGNDSGCRYITHYDFWRELYYFHKLVGVSAAQTIYHATLSAAEILGIAHETGSIEAGKAADFLIVADNPLDDLRALRKPYMVVVRGRVYHDPKIKRRLPEIDAKLDKCFP